jgi:[histone H3]-lysine36 N-trimethyltransferase
MNSGRNRKDIKLETEVRGMKLEEQPLVKDKMLNEEIPVSDDDVYHSSSEPNGLQSHSKTKSASQSPVKASNAIASPADENKRVEGTKADVAVKMEQAQPPKLSRTASQKNMARPAQLFLDSPDKTAEASETFQVISDCTYAAKYLGCTEHALECDCTEEWGKLDNRTLPPERSYY